MIVGEPIFQSSCSLCHTQGHWETWDQRSTRTLWKTAGDFHRPQIGRKQTREAKRRLSGTKQENWDRLRQAQRSPLQSRKGTHSKVTQSWHCQCCGKKGKHPVSRQSLPLESQPREVWAAGESDWGHLGEAGTALAGPDQIGVCESTQSISICLEHSRMKACDRVRTGCGKQLLVFGADLHCLGFLIQNILFHIFYYRPILEAPFSFLFSRLLGCQFQRHLQVISKTLFQPSSDLAPSVPPVSQKPLLLPFSLQDWPMPSHASGHRKACYQPGTSFPPFYFSQSLTHTSKPSTNVLFSVEPDSARLYCSSFVPPLNYSVFIFT